MKTTLRGAWEQEKKAGCNCKLKQWPRKTTRSRAPKYLWGVKWWNENTRRLKRRSPYEPEISAIRQGNTCRRLPYGETKKHSLNRSPPKCREYAFLKRMGGRTSSRNGQEEGEAQTGLGHKGECGMRIALDLSPQHIKGRLSFRGLRGKVADMEGMTRKHKSERHH